MSQKEVSVHKSRRGRGLNEFRSEPLRERTSAVQQVLFTFGLLLPNAERAGAEVIGAIILLSVNKRVHNEVMRAAHLVITKSDDAQPTFTEAATTQLTTEEPDPPIKMTEMDVRSEITMRYAHTAIVTRVQNPAKRSQEATFRVLLPETAFISGFVMTLDGKSYKAYVKGKEEAKNIYNQAVSQGYGAAHISAKARDSNIFTVSVNVEPRSAAVFNLTYEELLTRRNGVYNHAVNLHPGALVPKLTVVVHIKETQPISELRVPEVRTGNEVDATEEDAQNTNAVIERGAKDREATITFKPDLEEQKRLIQIYKEKSKERRVNSYGYDYEASPTPQDGILGQFVVQYDVDRTKGSDILVNDGYFVHFFAPTSLPPLSKHVVFVLDTSGSMSGRKMEQLIAAMLTILAKLNKGDVFNIVQFESSVQILDIKSFSESSPPVEREYGYYRENAFEMPALLPPVEATPENIAKAKLLVSGLRAGGGTNIATALDVAIALIQKGASVTNSTSATTTPKADGSQATSDSAANTEVAQESDKEKVHNGNAKNSESIDDKKEPIVIFLTDGEPTVGEGNPSRIIKIVAEKNYGTNKASIFSLAFGEDADRTFLRKLSLKNDGFMRHIYEASDASLQLRDFYRQISSPLLADVKFTYPPDQVKEGSLTKSKFRRFYAGSEAIVAGRIEENIAELTPHIYGICGVGLDDAGRKRYEVSTKTPVERGRDSYLPLERLWAYLTIQQLLDERHIADISDDDELSPAKKALKLALKVEKLINLISLSESSPPFATSQLSSPQQWSNSFDVSFPTHIKKGGASQFVFSSGLASNYPIPLSGLPSPLAVNGYVERFEDMLVESEDEIVAEPPSTTPILTTSLSPLKSYRLYDFPWTEPLLNSSSDCIALQINGTQLDLKLSKDAVAPSEATGDVECSTATDNSTGLCVYLTRCYAARNITVDTYSRTYCVVSNGYAGVCCPRSEVDKTP
ncbi:unnamed protein product, partial [Iphiclides podalirius]